MKASSMNLYNMSGERKIGFPMYGDLLIGGVYTFGEKSYRIVDVSFSVKLDPNAVEVFSISFEDYFDCNERYTFTDIINKPSAITTLELLSELVFIHKQSQEKTEEELPEIPYNETVGYELTKDFAKALSELFFSGKGHHSGPSKEILKTSTALGSNFTLKLTSTIL